MSKGDEQKPKEILSLESSIFEWTNNDVEQRLRMLVAHIRDGDHAELAYPKSYYTDIIERIFKEAGYVKQPPAPTVADGSFCGRSQNDEVERVFDQYDYDTTGIPRHWLRTRENKAALDKAVAAIAALRQTDREKYIDEGCQIAYNNVAVDLRGMLNEPAKIVEYLNRIAPLEKEDT